MFYFPLLVFNGIYDYIGNMFLFFQGALSKRRNKAQACFLLSVYKGGFRFSDFRLRSEHAGHFARCSKLRPPATRPRGSCLMWEAKKMECFWYFPGLEIGIAHGLDL